MTIMLRLFQPKNTLTEEETQQGLRGLTRQMVIASGADGLVSGGFLTAFALILGASNFHIGIMMAVPFLVQPLQILIVVLIERVRMRKVIAVSSYFVVYASWAPIAVIPFVLEVPNAGAVSVLLFFVAVRGVASASLNTSWNGWLRDIVPQEILGKFFADRTRTATIAAAIVGMGAALFIDLWKGQVSPENVVFGYSLAILFGSMIMGMAAVGAMATIPELRMPTLQGPRPSALKTLSAPLKDRNFRQLVNFLFLFHVAAHMAVPFFAVYMLTRLDMSLTAVVGLGVLSQVATVLFLRVWGPIIDRYGSKAVLSVNSALYFIVILGWAFTTMPEKHVLTFPLLVFLHLLIGIANAGVGVGMTAMRLKMTPQAQSTSYMMVSSVAINLGAGISPLLGGAFADFFSVRQFKISIEWIDPTRTVDLPAFFLTGYDFLFGLAFIVGLFTLAVLAGVREEGEAEAQEVMDDLMVRTRDNLRALSAVPGLGLMAHFPLTTLRRLHGIPGLDVAVGVTAYQLASSLNTAVTAASRGVESVSDVAQHVSSAVSEAIGQLEELGTHGIEASRELSREAIRTIDGASLNVERLARGVVSGTLHALANANLDPLEAVFGVAEGAIIGAGEIGADLEEAVQDVVKGAREAASGLGLSEEEAEAQASKGVVEATGALSPEQATQVRKALVETLVDEGETPE
ncbi:MAG: MFS transporter [Chloroflexi bacterium]|nr:MFS transporter [Chloroflexota bacterium]